MFIDDNEAANVTEETKPLVNSLKVVFLEKVRRYKELLKEAGHQVSNGASEDAIVLAKHRMQTALVAVHNADRNIPAGDYELAANIIKAEIESESTCLADVFKTLAM